MIGRRRRGKGRAGGRKRRRRRRRKRKRRKMQEAGKEYEKETRSLPTVSLVKVASTRASE